MSQSFSVPLLHFAWRISLNQFQPISIISPYISKIRILSGSEQIHRLSIQEKYGFLRFMNNKLKIRVEVFCRVLPYKSAVVAFVLHNLLYWHNLTLHFCRFEKRDISKDVPFDSLISFIIL